MKKLVLLLGVLLFFTAQSYAGHHACCADCGGQQNLRKVCRWVPEETEVKGFEWKCECEDICIPGPSDYCIKDECEECPTDCCGPNCVRHLGGHWNHKKEWGPPCGCCVKTVKRLVRVETVKQVTVYKCVIETVCDRCCPSGGCTSGNCAEGAPVGPPQGAPELAPMDGAPTTDAPMPPLPPSPDRQASSRKSGKLNPILTAFSKIRR